MSAASPMKSPEATGKSSGEGGVDHAELLRVAAAWQTRLDAGLDAGERVAFESWLAADARHAAAFREIEETWRLLNSAGRLSPAQLGVGSDGRALEGGVEEDHHPERFPRLGLRAVPGWATAAIAAAAIVIAWIFLWPSIPADEAGAGFVTADAAPFQRVDLPDGSVARLNAGAAVELIFGPTERRVRLERGEAHFTVAKDPARPFVVAAAGLTVRAVGTAFNVASRADAVEVLVTEGRVRLEAGSAETQIVSARELSAGEKIVARKETGVATVTTEPVRATAEEIDAVLGWQRHLLRFDETRLEDIAAEFNRYNRQRLVIEGSQLRQRRFGGSFRADDIEGFLTLLGEVEAIEVERGAGACVVRRAR